MAHSAVIPSTNTPAVEVPAISVRELMPWALFFGLIGMLALYFVGAEQGALHVFNGVGIHEWVHDGRHLLGFPCH